MKNTFLTLLDHSLVILCTYLTVLTNKTTKKCIYSYFYIKIVQNLIKFSLCKTKYHSAYVS